MTRKRDSLALDELRKEKEKKILMISICMLGYCMYQCGGKSGHGDSDSVISTAIE